MAFSFTLGNNDTGDDYAGLTVTTIEASGPTDNLSGQPTVTVQNNSDSYILIDLGGLAAAMAAAGVVAPVTLDPANTRLEVFKTSIDEGITPVDVELYLLKVAHDTAQATWDERLSAVAWETPGALGGSDYDSTVLDTVSMDAASGVHVYDSAAFVAALENLINGVADHAGFKLQTSTAFGQVQLGAENGTTGERPRLVIVGSEGLGSGPMSASPGRAALAFTGRAPTAIRTTGPVALPGRATLAMIGRAPTVSQSVPGILTPAAATLSLTGRAPTVIRSTVTTAAPDRAAMAFTGHAPSVLQSRMSGTASLAFTGRAPTIVRSGLVLVVPGQALASFTGRAPTIIRTVGGGVGSLPHVFGTKVAPLLLRTLDEQFSAVTTLALPHRFSVKSRIVLRELDEQFTAAMGGSAAVLPHVFATKSGPIDLNDLDEQFAAFLGAQAGPSLSLATAMLAFTGRAPNVAVTVVGSYIEFPGRAALAFTGRAPTALVAGNRIALPGRATMAFIGRAPTAVIGTNRIATPGRAALAFTGRAPTVLRTTAPAITTQPASQSVTEGGTATFIVAASGSPTLTYQWQRDTGVGGFLNISGATSSVYNTPPTTLGDNGDDFRVVVSNPYGSATSNSANLTVNAGGATAVTASLVASRTSGVAPLSVMFDAVGTTHSNAAINTWRQLGYSFNFGDTGSGTWQHSGQSRNVERGGPLAAHVFESPGTYVVKMRARDSSGGANDGDTNQREVTVTVTNPNTVFGGALTICISRTSDTVGAPGGATLLTNQTGWPSWTSGRRYLFRAGQDFSSWGTPTINQRTDIQVGKFGAGAKPIVGAFQVEIGNPDSTGVNFVQRITIMDLAGTTFRSWNSSTDVMFLRLDVASDFSTVALIEWAGAVDWYRNNGNATTQAAMYWPHGLFVVECNLSGGHNGITGNGRYNAVLGCQVTLPQEHCIRLFQGYKCVISHNRPIDTTDTIRHHMKVQSEGSDAYADLLSASANPFSQYVLIAKNSIGQPGQPNQFAVALEPQNDVVAEGLQDFTVEENIFRHAGWLNDVILNGRRMISRGNTNTQSAFTDGYGNHGDGLPGGIGGAWDGPYYYSQPAITTSDPT